MLLSFDKDLTRQGIYAIGNEITYILGEDRDSEGNRVEERGFSEQKFVAEIMNPILITDINAISKLEPVTRDAVFSLYQSNPRITEYDGVSVSLDSVKYKGVWGPTIDTLIFAKAMLNDEDIFDEEVESAAEMACGIGMLGKYTIHKCDNLKELYLIDLNKKAIECAMEQDNVGKQYDNNMVWFSVGDARNVGGRKFDRVILNPPYVPRPKSIEDNPYEGVGLLHDMIVNGKKYLNDGGILLVNASSLCESIKDLAIEKARNVGGLQYSEIIARKRVPFKVNPILMNKEWVRYLERDHGLRKTPERGYGYWHTIEIIKLMYD